MTNDELMTTAQTLKRCARDMLHVANDMYHTATRDNGHCITCPFDHDETVCATGDDVQWGERNQRNINKCLVRYITNRNQRTAQTWTIVRQWVSQTGYPRAIISNDDITIRIYWRWERACWCVAGGPTLANGERL